MLAVKEKKRWLQRSTSSFETILLTTFHALFLRMTNRTTRIRIPIRLVARFCGIPP
jgi:hypothetical protein